MHCMMRFAGPGHGDRPFDPNEIAARVERLKADGRLPTPEEFLEALTAAILEEKAERET